MTYHMTSVRMAIFKNSTNSKYWKECREKETHLHCWWERKLIQILWRTAWSFLKELKTEIPFGSVQSLTHVQLFATQWTAARQASLFTTNSQSLLKLMSIKAVMPFNHLILYHPLLLPWIFPSIKVFSNESILPIGWPKYWSFSISPSNEYSALSSFKIDWFELPTVQGTLRSLLQHHSSKASILQRLAFFMVQHSHPYMTTGKTRQTFVSKWCLCLLICRLGLT